MGQEFSGAGTTKPESEGLSNEEYSLLDQVFHELSVRSSLTDDSIDKHTFLSFFDDIPGLLGERIFDVLSSNNDGCICWDEFIDGYRKFVYCTPDTKMEFLFQLFDLDGKGGIDKHELETVLLSIVRPPSVLLLDNIFSSESISQVSLMGPPSLSATQTSNKKRGSQRLLLDPIPSTPDIKQANKLKYGMNSAYSYVKGLVAKAFEDCDLDNSGSLDIKEFRTWVSDNPNILTSLDDIFIKLAWEIPTISAAQPYSMIDAEAGTQRYSLSVSKSDITVSCENCNVTFIPNEQYAGISDPDDEKDHEVLVVSFGWADEPNRIDELKYCAQCGTKLTRDDSVFAARRSSKTRDSVENLSRPSLNHKYEGFVHIYPPGRAGLETRFLQVQGKFLYYYELKTPKSQGSAKASLAVTPEKEKMTPKDYPEEVIFIQGYFAKILIDRSVPSDSAERNVIRLIPPLGSSSRLVQFYVKRERDALKWRDMLEIAAQTVDIKKHYDLESELGLGAFGVIYKAVDKVSKKTVAVKAIRKEAVSGSQKETIRVELSIMRLTRHPNVIRLEHVFETPTHIYVVMQYCEGGDLFDHIVKVGDTGIKEEEAKKMTWKILKALQYLHGLGIVHHDLKPENILLRRVNDPTSVVITDFGLSKFLIPNQQMYDHNAGTTAYLPPEVLRGLPYGKEVDVWSVGVILYTALCVKLPFGNHCQRDISQVRRCVLRDPLKFNEKRWMRRTTHCMDLIRKLLRKDHSQRLTIDAAIEHEWFESMREKEPPLTPSKEQQMGMNLFRKRSISTHHI